MKSMIWTNKAVLLFLSAAALSQVTPLDRIQTRSGSPYAEFYNTVTGKRFYPNGTNYVVIHWIEDQPIPDDAKAFYHALFSPAYYDPADVESDLSAMNELGFNCVRVWCYQGNSLLREEDPPIYSVEGPYNATDYELYGPYIANLLDFLKRCTNHGIYVLLTCDRIPNNSVYLAYYATGTPGVEGIQREYMSTGGIAAKKIYLRKLIREIKYHDPGLLNTVFAWDLTNEIHAETDIEPFCNTTGTVFTGNGQYYDMSSPSSRQACFEDNALHFFQECSNVLKDEDPQALVGCSVFPFSAVGKSGMATAGLLPVDMPDIRWPLRPLVIERDSALDFVDIHCYMPWDFQDVLFSSEWSSIDKTHKPFTVGEWGAHRKQYTLEAAAQGLFDYRKNNFYSHGFYGTFLFTFDEDTHHRISAMEQGALLGRYLRPNANYYWDFDDEIPVHWWSEGHGIGSLTFTSDDRMAFDINDRDPYLYSPEIRMDTDERIYLRIRLRNNSPGVRAQLFWITESDPSWDEAKSKKFDILPDQSVFREYLVCLGEDVEWQGIVKKLRFDPIENSAGYGWSYEVDYIDFETAEERLTGDFDSNRYVDMNDFLIMSNNWNLSDKLWYQGDTNSDLDVDVLDLINFSANWLKER